MSEQNSCVICLEGLAEKAIGACAPCGHCLHVECFDSWCASRLGRSSVVKCPMCNAGTTTFCRLFIDLGSLELDGNVGDDDSLSLSSDESFVDDENIDPEEETNGDHGRSDDEVEVREDNNIITIDDDDEPDPNAKVAKEAKRQSRSQDALSSDGKKYKKKAKNYKKRVAMLESQQMQQREEQQKLLDRLREKQEELQATAEELEEITEQYSTHQRKVEGLSLRVTTLKRERDELAKKHTEADQRASKRESQLQEIERHYKRKLKEESLHAMNEAQQLRDAYPKVVNEKRDLEDQVRKLRLQLRAQIGSMELEGGTTKNKKVQDTRALLREMSMHEERYNHSSKQRARKRNDYDHDNEEARENQRSKKMISAHAARISQASFRKPVARKVSGIDALDAIDSKKPMERIEIPSFLKPAPNNKRRFLASSSHSRPLLPNPSTGRQKSMKAIFPTRK